MRFFAGLVCACAELESAMLTGRRVPRSPWRSVRLCRRHPDGTLMILNSSDSATHGGDQRPDPSKSVDRPVYSSGPFPSWPTSSADEPNWNGAPLYKKLLFGGIFLVAFSLLDR